MGITASSEIFNILRERAVALLVEWHYSADPRMSGSRAALADHLHVALEDFATRSGIEDTQRSYVIGKVTDYLALDFDPTKLQGKKDRKRLMHVVEGMSSVRKRQQAGAEFSNGVRKSRSLEKLMGVYREMQERGEDLSVERLAMRASVSRSTAYKHFLACQQNCPIGCIDKKQPGLRKSTIIIASMRSDSGSYLAVLSRQAPKPSAPTLRTRLKSILNPTTSVRPLSARRGSPHKKVGFSTDSGTLLILMMPRSSSRDKRLWRPSRLQFREAVFSPENNSGCHHVQIRADNGRFHVRSTFEQKTSKVELSIAAGLLNSSNVE